MKTPHFGLRSWCGLALLALSVLPPACKDKNPCDPDQHAVGTSCLFDDTGGSGSKPAPQAGAPSDAGAADAVAGAPSGIEPPGNPDATFGTTCASNADCGGPAPICATDPLFYCIQINCSPGEEHEGECPAKDWVCFPKDAKNPSACVSTSSF